MSPSLQTTADEPADGTEPSGSPDHDWRVADDTDILGIMSLLAAMHEEDDIFKRYPLERAKVLERLQTILSVVAGVVLIIEKDGRIVASVALQIQPPWFSHQPSLVEIWFYVRKGHRRSTYAEQLIRACKEYGDKLGLDVQLNVITSKQANRKNALYRRHLMAVGESFIHLVNNNEDAE